MTRAGRARLLVDCPDQPGIIAAVSGFLHGRGANILTSDQYTSADDQHFFLRMTFAVDVPVGVLSAEFRAEVGKPFDMNWQFTDAMVPKRVALLVSKPDHCLQELLWRRRRGELDAEVVLVASNHRVCEEDVRTAGIAFHHVPVLPGAKARAELDLLALLKGRCDLVVLARYMQVLSGDFLEQLAIPVINIHHSFLPAFSGAGPYERARRRGVKLVGATAHYVVEEVDAGPIIEQDVVRVSHRDEVPALERLGADVERSVLFRAVQQHCQDRVVRHGGVNVVF